LATKRNLDFTTWNYSRRVSKNVCTVYLELRITVGQTPLRAELGDRFNTLQ